MQPRPHLRLTPSTARFPIVKRGGLRTLSRPVVVLASLTLAIVVASVVVTNAMRTLHRAAVEDIAARAQQGRLAARVAASAAAVNAPGNDVFASGDVAREEARLDSAVVRLRADLDVARAAFRQQKRGPELQGALRHLDELASHGDTMVAEARQVFASLRAGRRDEAAVHMALMDRALERGNTVARAIRQSQQENLQQSLHRQQERVELLRNVQTTLVAGVLLLLLAVVVNSRRLIRQALEYDEDRHARLAELALRDAELEERGVQLEREVQERTEEVREQHRFLLQVIDTIPHFVFVKDRAGRFTLANEAVGRAYGVAASELIGRSDADFNPNADEVEQFRREDVKVIDTLQPRFIAAERITDANGTEHWLQTVKRPLLGPDGRADHVLGISTDITALRQASEQSQQLATIVQASGDAIFSTDLDGRVRSWNAGAERLYGYCAAEVLGRPMAELVPPEAAEFSDRLRAALAAGEKVFHGETVGRRKDGKMFDIALTVSQMHDAEGALIGYSAIARDITEMKRAQSQLRDREMQLADAQQTARLGSWTFDAPTGEVFWSDELFRALSLEPGSAAPSLELFLSLVHPEDVAYVVERVDRTMKTGESSHYVFRHLSPTGEVRVYDSQTRVILDAERRPSRLVGTVLDITELKRTEAAEREARQAAEAASRAKSEFLANMSHEIRTPMNGVMGMLELTLASELTEQQRDLVQTAWSSAEALLSIINDVLDFSKIEAGHLVLDPVPFRLRGTLSSTLAALQMRAAEKGISLDADVDAEVPDALVGDAGRLRQVLINIVGNAIKFTDRGGVDVRIRASRPHVDEVELQVAVRDTGVGIPPEKQRLVFEAFQQADSSTSRQFGGTGLGLAISARLVALLGGEIRVESEEGRGSTFAFTALMQEDPEAADSPPARPSDAEGQAVRLPARPLRILVAEDNPVNRRIVRMLLERQGHRVTEVFDGAVAVDTMRHESFDVVIMDIQMPGMSGLEATRQIRQHEALAGHSRTPIVALTAGAMSGDREACLAAGMDAFIAKPLRGEQLLATIAELAGDEASSTADRPLVTRQQPLDEERLLHTVGGDRALLKEIVTIFLEDYPVQLQRIRTAVREGDADGLRFAAHSVKGATASLSAPVAAAVAERLERLGADGNTKDAPQLLASLEIELARLADLLQTLTTRSEP